MPFWCPSDGSFHRVRRIFGLVNENRDKRLFIRTIQVEYQIKLEGRTHISPRATGFEESVSVETQEGGPYGVPHTFTLADSFYDAQGSDVFVSRTEHPLSVEPVSPHWDQLRPPGYAHLAAPPRFSTTGQAPLPEYYPYSTSDLVQSVRQPVQGPQVVQTTQTEYHGVSAQERMEGSFRIPVVATLVFVITMIAIYYMGGQVGSYYAPVVRGEDIEFVGRPQPAN